MIDSIFVWPSIRQRQKEAPLLQERELFLSHLLQQGCKHVQVRSIATTLLHVVRLMELQTLRDIHPAEVRIAGERWVRDDKPHITRQIGPRSAATFCYVAARWFRFHKVLITPPLEKKPYDELLGEFLRVMQDLRGLATEPHVSAEPTDPRD